MLKKVILAFVLMKLDSALNCCMLINSALLEVNTELHLLCQCSNFEEEVFNQHCQMKMQTFAIEKEPFVDLESSGVKGTAGNCHQPIWTFSTCSFTSHNHQLLKEGNLGSQSITFVALANPSMACIHRWDEDCLHIPAPGPYCLTLFFIRCAKHHWDTVVILGARDYWLNFKIKPAVSFYTAYIANIQGCIW